MSLPNSVVCIVGLVLGLSTFVSHCFASEASHPEADSVLVLEHARLVTRSFGHVQTQIWEKTNKLTYFSTNAIIDLTLKDGQKILSTKLVDIEKSSLILENGDRIPLTAIRAIRNGKTKARLIKIMLGIFLLLLGIIGWIIRTALFIYNGRRTSSEDDTFQFIIGGLLPTFIILGGIKIFPKSSWKNLAGRKHSLSMVGKPTLTEKKQKLFSKRGFVKTKNL
ncbi:MAG: hypothetical protein AAF587_22525 [Bacteroidota bacterium]